MYRWQIIQLLIDKFNYKRYLEIGISGRDCFNKIICSHKDGVDPAGNCNYIMTSNDFFNSYNGLPYSLIFIDGLHLKEQAELDINNALENLEINGTIVIHDILPELEWHQKRTCISGKPWTGDVWKTFADLRCNRPDLEMYVVDTDWGCGIIRRGIQKTYYKPDENWKWDHFTSNKKDILNIISITEFIRKIKNE